ncbi:hypothetical protein WA026_014716 [Henosepilachna vigintioctopunctata]|uniref:Uncharacterized protein n=1 Tax=Henosepilachna vigintioctopunctata TaxID=420089 RepID=A0AAW1VGX3_9CUCU
MYDDFLLDSEVGRVRSLAYDFRRLFYIELISSLQPPSPDCGPENGGLFSPYSALLILDRRSFTPQPGRPTRTPFCDVENSKGTEQERNSSIGNEQTESYKENWTFREYQCLKNDE